MKYILLIIATLVPDLNFGQSKFENDTFTNPNYDKELASKLGW
jgi:hypothetical protein